MLYKSKTIYILRQSNEHKKWKLEHAILPYHNKKYDKEKKIYYIQGKNNQVNDNYGKFDRIKVD